MPVQIVANGFGERDIRAFSRLKATWASSSWRLENTPEVTKDVPALTLHSGNARRIFGFLLRWVVLALAVMAQVNDPRVYSGPVLTGANPGARIFLRTRTRTTSPRSRCSLAICAASSASSFVGSRRLAKKRIPL
jgi:hypothetical protein